MPLNKRFAKILIFCLLFLIAFVIRIVPVVKDTVHFSFDQGLDIIMVKNLVVDHKINLISRYSGLQGVLMGPLWTWFLALPFIMASGDPVGNVVWLSLLSVASSLMTYLIVKKILGETAGFISLVGTLFMPFFVGASQIVLSPHPLTYLFIFYIWFLYEIFIHDKNKFFLPLGLLVGFFFQFEIAFAIFTLPPIIVLCFINKKLPTPTSIVLFGLTFIPQLIFDFRHQFLISKSLLGFFTGHNNSLYSQTPPLLARFISRANSFWNDFIDMTISTRQLVVLLPVMVITIFGWWKIFRDKVTTQISMLKILFIILGCFYIAFSFYPGAIWGWYRQGLPIVYLLLLTIPISYLFEKSKFSRLSFLILGTIFVVYTVNPINVINQLTINNQVASGIGEQKEILDYVYQSSGGKFFSYFAYTPPVYDYIWQYDFWWYGQKQYHYLPNNWQMGVPLLGIGEQQKPPKDGIGLFYLIIEPDSDRPWAPDGWKKSYIKIGTIEEKKEFPGGIIVEKRRA